MSIRPMAMRDVFLEQIWKKMADDQNIFFVSADFGSPILDKIRADFPDRFVNVGIAEQNLINVTAGLALEGYTVFAYAIAPFITMRCYEQARVSLALLSEVRPMNVNLIGVGAGYSYVVSGPTHQCYEDITLMRALPNFEILSPSDHLTTKEMFNRVIENQRLKYLRFDAQVLPTIYHNQLPNIKTGFHVHQTGGDFCIIATGYMLHTALQIAKQFENKGDKLGVIDLFNLTHFSEEQLESVLRPYIGLISMEEGFRGRGGVDSMLFEWISRRRLKLPMLNIGVEPGYRFELGGRAELHEQVGIGVHSATKSIRDFIKSVDK